MTRRKLKLTVVAMVMVAAIGSAYSLGFQHPVHGTVPPVISMAETQAASNRVTNANSPPDLTGIIERNGPAVVNISIAGTRKASTNIPDTSEIDPDDPFFEFFRRFGMPRQQGEAVPIRGMGSGFIVDANGTILTNAHVVDGADEVTVKLIDKREFKAKLVGIDKTSDVAVLKIEAKGLPFVRLGNAKDARVGEWVVAIGSPYGFENSASAGIISAKARALPDGSYVPFIQTDVAVNPGNSGGPLFNMQGEVIGINSQIYSRSGGYQGISFAIPIELAMNVEHQLLAHGKVQRGKLGVTIQEVNQSLAESFGLKTPMGALVSSVEKDSPAAKAGVEAGDVILSINGQTIIGSSELPAIVANMAQGSSAQLSVWRHGSARELTVKVGQLDEQVADNDVQNTVDKGKLGVAVRPLKPQEKRQAEANNGLLVENASGPAARAGIQAGDIILSVNGDSVRSVEQFRELIRHAGKHAAVLVERGETRIYVPVNLG